MSSGNQCFFRCGSLPRLSETTDNWGTQLHFLECHREFLFESANVSSYLYRFSTQISPRTVWIAIILETVKEILDAFRRRFEWRDYHNLRKRSELNFVGFLGENNNKLEHSIPHASI